MDFFETIYNRHSVRKFTEEIPPKKIIYQIIDAARVAPSAHNKQMWHFLVIYNQEIQNKLKNAVIAKYEEIQSYPEAKGKENKLEFSKKYGSFFSNAPVVIAVLLEPAINTVHEIMLERNTSLETLSRMRPRPDIQSVGAAIQNILLTAEALGYGTCWCTAPVVAYKEMEAILNCPKEKELVAIIALGKEHELNVSNAKKKNLDEIMTIIE